MGTEQINLMMHNTLYVPGHFHGTVVAGTTLAFMAVTYLLIPLIFQREVSFPRLARWQPYVFAIGVSGISLFMMGAGTLGVARRHWDITFADAALPFHYPTAAFLMLTLNGIFALLAALGGLMYVVVVVSSVFFGKKTAAAPATRPAANAPASGPGVVGAYGSAGTLRIPGTVILVGVFFVAFVLYYFVNWKYLGEIWPLR
jgi:cytochrome c oxidase subunit 1